MALKCGCGATGLWHAHAGVVEAVTAGVVDAEAAVGSTEVVACGSEGKSRGRGTRCVLTPFYKEDVLYSEEELNKENEDGISILFYLQKIYPDKWRNFLERVNMPSDKNPPKRKMELSQLTCQWVSYRGQTLSRTVRGMMYYRQALELQCFLDMAENRAILSEHRTISQDKDYHDQMIFATRSQAIADMKFTYVVSCQIYGMQKKSTEPRDGSCYQNILNLMLMFPSLRIAYIDEMEETVNGISEKVYYSVLVKGGDKLDESSRILLDLAGPRTDLRLKAPLRQQIVYGNGNLYFSRPIQKGDPKRVDPIRASEYFNDQ